MTLAVLGWSPSNTPDTAFFLDRSKPSYIGGSLEMANDRLSGFWSGLTEVLQTGRPQNEIEQTGRSMFEELWRPRSP